MPGKGSAKWSNEQATAPETCAREDCGKKVYPLEELKYLDKVYHKQCFKCSECGTTLNLKTCKSFNKQPYCAPHVPKTVPSYTTDSLDLQRVAENTKNQSETGYRADYEKNVKGHKTDTSDDFETVNRMQATKLQSNVARSNVIYADGKKKGAGVPVNKPLQAAAEPAAENEGES